MVEETVRLKALEVLEKVRRNLELAKRCFGVQAETIRRVSLRDVEEKIWKIISEKPFIVIDYSRNYEAAYDLESGLIYVNPEIMTIYVNHLLERFPYMDWELYVERVIRHELVHKEDVEYLLSKGLTLEEIDKPEYHYAREFHALNVVPPLKEENEYFRQDIFRASLKELEEALKDPGVWVKAAYTLSEDEIKEIFGPLDASVSMLHLKKVGRKIQTKEDIIKYAPEFLKYMERR
jgi:hypothetical protein